MKIEITLGKPKARILLEEEEMTKVREAAKEYGIPMANLLILMNRAAEDTFLPRVKGLTLDSLLDYIKEVYEQTN